MQSKDHVSGVLLYTKIVWIGGGIICISAVIISILDLLNVTEIGFNEYSPIEWGLVSTLWWAIGFFSVKYIRNILRSM